MKSYNEKRLIRNFYLLLLACVFFGTGWLTNEKVSKLKENTTVKNTTTKTIKQEQFNEILERMALVDLENYLFNPEKSDYGMSVRAIDKELSFGKREILSLSGKVEMFTDISTEKAIRFYDGSKVFTVTMMINSTIITNDFQGGDWLYMTQDVYCVPYVMSYKNIIVMTTLQDTEDYVDYVEGINLTKRIVEELSKLEKNQL